MSNINQVCIEGNLTRAAELSHWQDGKPYCRFTIASNESYKDQNGQWQDVTSFIDCMCTGNYAESMSKHLLKGRRLTVTGRLKQQRWTDDAGNKHYNIFVKVRDISLAPGGFTPKGDGTTAEQIQNDYNQAQEDDSGYIPF